MNQIEVLVKDKTTGDQRTMTYKSFLDLQDRFALIGQSDSEGNLIPGDPNLAPRHKKVAAEDVAVHAVDAGINGMTMEDKLKKKEELIARFAPPQEVKPPEVEEPAEIQPEAKPDVKERKKPGPKPKVAA